jgi:hypothetical protein
VSDGAHGSRRASYEKLKADCKEFRELQAKEMRRKANEEEAKKAGEQLAPKSTAGRDHLKSGSCIGT